MNSADTPSSRKRVFTTVTPDVFVSKLAFCVRVFTTSNGAETVIDAMAPETDATKFRVHVAFE